MDFLLHRAPTESICSLGLTFMTSRDLGHYGMLSRAETDFLKGEKQAKPNQLRYLRHCVKRKIRALRENDLPAIMANDWARAMFRNAIEANNGGAIESNSALRTPLSETQDLSGPDSNGRPPPCEGGIILRETGRARGT